MMSLFYNLAEFTAVRQQFEDTYYVGAIKTAQQRNARLICPNSKGLFFPQFGCLPGCIHFLQTRLLNASASL